MAVEILGIDTVLKNLSREIVRKGGATTAGLVEAAHYVERVSSAKVPRRLGNLFASKYVKKESATAVVMGYGAAYAKWVHENTAMKLRGKARRKPYKGVYWGPSGEAKFLEKAIRGEHRKNILKIIANRAGKR